MNLHLKQYARIRKSTGGKGGGERVEWKKNKLFSSRRSPFLFVQFFQILRRGFFDFVVVQGGIRITINGQILFQFRFRLYSQRIFQLTPVLVHSRAKIFVLVVDGCHPLFNGVSVSVSIFNEIIRQLNDEFNSFSRFLDTYVKTNEKTSFSRMSISI